ncbi:MAG TPA: alginate lyase family protein [Gemmatimonadales bacterium]|nr:alginate lyase family protein [Gemmatimonadales bacterium]
MIGLLKGRSLRELRDRSASAVRLARERAGLDRGLREPTGRDWRGLLASGSTAEDVDVAAVVAAARRVLPGLTDSSGAAAIVRNSLADDSAAILARADLIAAGTFPLLGFDGLDFGMPVDWHRDPVSGLRAPMAHWSRVPYLDADVVGDHKVTWELSRHQFLVTLAQAALLSGDRSYVDSATGYLTSWMDHNPPGQGMNWASSLEVAFRSISWIWTIALVGDQLEPELVRRMVGVLHRHGRHLEHNLSTWFSPNTHLTGEALGLVYLGQALPLLRDATRWRWKGLAILANEHPRQVLPDGVYFEQATYYHRYTTDFYLHLALLHDAAGEARPAWLEPLLTKLLDYLVAIRRPDHTWPLIGDEDGGRLVWLKSRNANDFRDTLALGGWLLGRPEYCSPGAAAELVWLLGEEAVEADEADKGDKADRAVKFPHGGYAVLGDASVADWMLFKAGPQGGLSAGHSHCDALAIEWMVGGTPLVMDAGTFTYLERDGERNAFRGGSRHATITIDGQAAAEPGAPFRWKRKADARLERWVSATDATLAVGSVAGFSGRAEGLRHRRTIVWLSALRAWVVFDEVPGVGVFTAHFPSAAGLGLRMLEGGAEWTRPSGAVATLRTTDREATVTRRDSWYSPVYGRKLPVPAIDIRPRTGALACVLYAGGVGEVQVAGSREHGELRLRIQRRADVAEVVMLGDVVQVNGRTLDDGAMTD